MYEKLPDEGYSQGAEFYETALIGTTFTEAAGEGDFFFRAVRRRRFFWTGFGRAGVARVVQIDAKLTKSRLAGRSQLGGASGASA
jgi:hypothetical protein